MEMIDRGHEILFTYRQKEVEEELLEAAGFRKKCFGRHYKTKLGKIWGLFRFNWLMLRTIQQFRPDILLSHGTLYPAQMAWLTGRTYIALEDTGNWEQVRLYLPFAKCVLTSTTFPKDYGYKQVRYSGHHELAYLHPKRFAPNGSFKPALKERSKAGYVLLRFVSWNATHDVGQKGLSAKTKNELIETLQEKYQVFISSEAALPAKYEKYRINFPVDKIHDALYYADMLISEGTTMAMEAAILGTPSAYVNSLQHANIDDMVKYGLVINRPDDRSLIEVVKNLMHTENLTADWRKKKEKMLEQNIDVTAFLVWFIESWPESFDIMKSNPAFQEKFR